MVRLAQGRDGLAESRDSIEPAYRLVRLLDAEVRETSDVDLATSPITQTSFLVDCCQLQMALLWSAGAFDEAREVAHSRTNCVRSNVLVVTNSQKPGSVHPRGDIDSALNWLVKTSLHSPRHSRLAVRNKLVRESTERSLADGNGKHFSHDMAKSFIMKSLDADNCRANSSARTRC